MVTPEEQSFLVGALDPLRGPLHYVLPSAAEIADGHFSDFDMDSKEYRAGRAHLARCHARRLLLAEPAMTLGGWAVTPPGPNARLWLALNALKLRLLRPLPGSQVPPPGSNRARIAFYSNQHASVLGIAGSDLIALWDIDRDGEAVIRVIRPRGRWRYGSTAKVDIDFTLPRPPESLADLQFIPTDDHELPLPFESEDEEGVEGLDDSDR